jgi:hypothetical protein
MNHLFFYGGVQRPEVPGSVPSCAVCAKGVVCLNAGG